MDNITREQRRVNMQNVKSYDSIIELKIRSFLHKNGLRFRKNVKNLFGCPDIVFKKLQIAIFIDSCFWHKCRYHYRQPKSRLQYWIPKIERNVSRDKKVNKKLKNDGWIVIRIWEHSIKNNFEDCMSSLIKKIKEKEMLLEKQLTLISKKAKSLPRLE